MKKYVQNAIEIKYEFVELVVTLLLQTKCDYVIPSLLLKNYLRLVIVLLLSIFYVAYITNMIMIFFKSFNNHLKITQKLNVNFLK